MRIISVYYTHKPGGFCKRLYRLLNALSKNGHEVHYLTLDAAPTALASAIKTHYIPFPLKRRQGLLFWALFSFFAPLYLLQKIFHLKPDKLVVFGPYYASILGPAKFLYKLPLILFIRAGFAYHEQDMPLKRFALSFFNRIGLRCATRIICQTKVMREEILALLPAAAASKTELLIIANDLTPITLQHEHNSDTDNKTKLSALCSGLFVKSKNLDLLYAAFVQLEKRHGPKVYNLVIAGEGPSLRTIQQQASQEKIQSIDFLGWQADLRPLYAKSDLFLFPSLGEGMPNSVLEALGAGLPVLASDIAVLREVLLSDELLFNPFDATSLANRIEALGDNPQQLQKLKEICLKRSQAYIFDWDAQVCQAVCK